MFSFAWHLVEGNSTQNGLTRILTWACCWSGEAKQLLEIKESQEFKLGKWISDIGLAEQPNLHAGPSGQSKWPGMGWRWKIVTTLAVPWVLISTRPRYNALPATNDLLISNEMQEVIIREITWFHDFNRRAVKKNPFKVDCAFVLWGSFSQPMTMVGPV